MRRASIAALLGLLLMTDAAAEPLVLVESFTSTTNRNDHTGSSAALSDTRILIGTARYDHHAEPRKGAAKLFDLQSRALVQDFLKPSPITDRNFGAAVGLSDANAIVCGHGHPPEGGYVVVYDLESGEQIHRLQEPGEMKNEQFGRRCAINDLYALVSEAKDSPAGGYERQGAVHLYDLVTGKLIRTFTPPFPRRGGRFGLRVALDGRFAVITAYKIVKGISPDGAVFVYDVDSGKLLHTFTEPVVAYTSGISISNGLLLVGYTFARINGRKHTGAAAIYDLETGEMLHLLTAPGGFKNRNFGADVALNSRYALIGAQDAVDRQRRFRGMAFLFDLVSGELIQIITPPQGSELFPINVTMTEDWAALGTNRYSPSPESRGGAVHLYKINTH